MTIASELTTLSNTKAAIKTAIEAKGVTVGTAPFNQYATKIGEISGGGGGFSIPAAWSQEWYEEVLAYAESQAWTPPSDWLTLTVPAATDQVLRALVMITNSETNWVDISATGAFTVDWGDGSSPENFASGAVATHNYTWSSISNSTLTSEGYRQAIFTVTPQSGETITIFKIGNDITGLTHYSTKIYDIVFAMNNAGDFQRAGTYNRNAELRRLRWIGTNTKTSFANFFDGMNNLQNFSMHTASATNMNSMFLNCRSLRTIPEIITSSVTNIGTMFSGCTSLITIPELDFTGATSGTISSMFNDCRSLITTPAITLPNAATTTSSMFSNCVSLLHIGPITWNGTVANRTIAGNSMFNNCHAMISQPQLLNSFTDGYVSFASVGTSFAGCWNLTELNVNISASSMSSPFDGCIELRKLTINLTGTTPYSISPFNPGSSLNNLESLSFTYPNGTATFTPNGISNTSLPVLRSFEVSCSSSTSSMVYNGKRSMGKLILNNCVASIDCQLCALGPGALVDLFTSLGTATAKTINITGNWGASLLTSEQRAIATGKGWTITG